MLKVEVRGVEGDKKHNPVQVFYGTITYDKGMLVPQPKRRDRVQLFRNLLSNPIYLDASEIDPSKEPEKWIKNVHRTSGHRLWLTKAR